MQSPTIPEFSDIPLRVRVPVRLTHVQNPCKFWVRLRSEQYRSDPFLRNFIRGHTKHFYEVSVGTSCIADVGKGFNLVRAFVVDVQADSSIGMQVSAEVFCVDYGFTVVVGMDQLFPLSPLDAKTPCLAIPCCLRRLALPCEQDSVEWCISPDSVLEAVFYGLSEAGVYQVDMFVLTHVNGKEVRLDVAKDLFQRGKAQRIWYPRRPQRTRSITPSSVAVGDHRRLSPGPKYDAA